MTKFFDLWEFARVINSLLLSFAFFVGIMLLVSRNAFTQFDSALQKEYGLKYQLLPKLEQPKIQFVDWLLLRYRFFSGLLISISAFILLLLSR